METTFSTCQLPRLGVKKPQEKIKRAFVGSIIASDELVNKNTIKRPSKSDTFKELKQSLELFNLLSHTQKKIQEALHKNQLAYLIRNQTSTKEKTRFQSLCLPHSGKRLAAPPIPSLVLHLLAKEFQASVKYRLGIAVCDQERKCLFAGQVHWTHWVTIQLPAMGGQMRFQGTVEFATI